MSSGSTPSTAIPFSHTAAGHAGISTSADGTLLIKPCTPAEISFYEAARHHPNFQAHMPVYMGSLTLNDSPEEQVAADVLRAAQTRRDSKGAEDASKTQPSSKTGHIVSEPAIQGTVKKEWTPSGGAKLSSNLSIVLSNATAGFVRPNVIDLKLGARLWDDDAPLEKRAKLDEVADTSTSGTLGFRVAGMKVYIGHDGDKSPTTNLSRDVNTTVADGYKTYDKFYGRSNILADGSNITSAWEEFLSSLHLTPRTEDTSDASGKAKIQARRKLLLQRLLRETESIQFALENEESRMYSASILMVYEGDPDALDSVLTYTAQPTLTAAPKPGVDPVFTGSLTGDTADPEEMIQDVEETDEDAMDPVAIGEDDNEKPKQKIHEVVMIDFAHAKFVSGQGPDENALRGVRSIRAILEGLLGGCD